MARQKNASGSLASDASAAETAALCAAALATLARASAAPALSAKTQSASEAISKTDDIRSRLNRIRDLPDLASETGNSAAISRSRASSTSAATASARIDASESAVADAVERVEVMENQVGAAVSASVAVASSAAALPGDFLRAPIGPVASQTAQAAHPVSNPASSRAMEHTDDADYALAMQLQAEYEEEARRAERKGKWRLFG